jgi:hypothetical protein
MSNNSITPILTIDANKLITVEKNSEVDNEKTFHFSINGNDYGNSSLGADTINALLKQVFEIADDLINVLISKNEIEKKIRSLGERIYQFLIPEKLGEYFEDENHRAILIRTSEQDIPWEVLCDKKGFLCHRIAFGREVSRTIAADYSDRRPTLNICLIGDPNNNLSAANEEISQLNTIFSDTLNRLKNDYSIKTELKILKKNDANKNNVLFETIASDIQWDIIHYAGHADFNLLHPDSSSLVLSDGKLRAYEIEKGLKSKPVVFVNACYSGLITQTVSLAGYGLLKGIATSFVKGGAMGYIGSIWPIGDLTAKKISEYFYVSILEGAEIGDALMIAKSTVFGENLDLAAIGYVLYGDPLSKLPLFEPQLTRGPYINEQGFNHVIQLEQEYSALEILLVNDLPWILWRPEDFINWIKRIPGSEKTRERILFKLFEYHRHFRNLILNGKKKFIGLTNLKTLNEYLMTKSLEAKLDLLNDFKDFSQCSNFTLMFYDGIEEEIEEIEIVSKNDDVFFNLSESVYVFNKQVRFEQKPINYSVNLDFNPNLIKQYANRFYRYYENNITQYSLRIGTAWTSPLMEVDNRILNNISTNILEELIYSNR